jgi:tRNA(Ile)-lysidine synthase
MLKDRVLRTLRRHDLIPAGSRVVAALSGGPDSMALAHVLAELQLAGEFTLAGLAHLNHRLRGDAAEADQDFCRAAAAALGVPIEIEAIDVAARAREEGSSIEAAARAARYEFLERAAARLEADRIAVGHTRDDQAETFLLRLLRGAGPRGLGGIRPRVGTIVRPLIDATRADVLEYLRDRDIAWRDDASNADVGIPRNRVRHELIPFLAGRFTPGIVDVLAREAAIAQEDAEWLDSAAIEIAPTIVLDSSQANVGTSGSPQHRRIRLDARALADAPVALARRVVRDALQAAGEGRPPGFEHVDAVMALEPGQSVDVPGVHAARHGAVIDLRAGPGLRSFEAAADKREANPFQYSLSIPGEVEVVEAGLIISADRPVGGELDGPARRGAAPQTAVAVSAAGLAGELKVRSRRPGDALRPIGLGGRKKLQDLLVDRKVAREERDRVPIVVDRSDRIVWVVGHAVAEDFRVTEPAAGVILLKARRLGGRG